MERNELYVQYIRLRDAGKHYDAENLLDSHGASNVEKINMSDWWWAGRPEAPPPVGGRDDEAAREGASNPKHAAGRAKPGMECAPSPAAYWWAYAQEDGAHKYGAYNWRDTKVQMSVYIAAAKRHLDLMLEGEWLDIGDEKTKGSDGPHAAHVMACMGILIDAYYSETLIDDSVGNGQTLRQAMRDIAGLRQSRGFTEKDPLLTRTRRKSSDSLAGKKGTNTAMPAPRKSDAGDTEGEAVHHKEQTIFSGAVWNFGDENPTEFGVPSASTD